MITECFHLGNKQINSAINRNVESHGEAGFEGNYDAFSLECNKTSSILLFSLNIKNDSAKHV